VRFCFTQCYFHTAGISDGLVFSRESYVTFLFCDESCIRYFGMNRFVSQIGRLGVVRSSLSTRRSLSDTVKLTFIERDGSRHEINAPVGKTLLEVSIDNDLDVEGACEGTLACSTCHMIFEPALYDKMKKPSEEENDMLDLAVGLTDTSRLGCQIKVTKELEGAVITLPEESISQM
jgi:2Fe-2S ferredoxin